MLLNCGVEENSLRVPWTARRSNQSILKEISPECSLERLMLKATWCNELTHLKRPWCWERLSAGGEGDDRGWDGWMASPTQWTWDGWTLKVGDGTGRPGILQFTGSQRVRHYWVTELNWRRQKNCIWNIIMMKEIKDNIKQKDRYTKFLGWKNKCCEND